MLFLDEPTTGLDPRSRGDLWEMLRDLVRNGTTIVLTTQYLEEADQLADDIVVLDHGRTVAHGTPDELKTQHRHRRIDVTVASRAELARGRATRRARFASNAPTFDDDAPRRHDLRSSRARGCMDVMRALDAAGIDAVDLNRREATLDDVFLTLTGADRRADDSEEVSA